MGFIDVLNQLLIDKGVSRNKFCADIGIGKNSVANWEGRGNAPDGETLIKIAHYFNVSTDYLLGIEKPAAPDGEQPALKERQKSRNEIMELLDRVPDKKLHKIKDLLQAAIDAVE